MASTFEKHTKEFMITKLPPEIYKIIIWAILEIFCILILYKCSVVYRFRNKFWKKKYEWQLIGINLVNLDRLWLWPQVGWLPQGNRCRYASALDPKTRNPKRKTAMQELSRRLRGRGIGRLTHTPLSVSVSVCAQRCRAEGGVRQCAGRKVALR